MSIRYRSPKIEGLIRVQNTFCVHGFQILVISLIMYPSLGNNTWLALGCKMLLEDQGGHGPQVKNHWTGVSQIWITDI